MQNPFPGVDPWMEGQWSDAHARLIIYACDALQPLLPPDLKARVEQRVYVAAGPPRRRSAPFQPDVQVIPRRAAAGAAVKVPSEAGATTTTPAAVAPLVVRLANEVVSEAFIEVRERRPSNRLVTVLEVLSPANKRAGPGRRQYLAKQRECLAAGVNMVEVDLLRGGRWTVVAPRESLPDDEAGSAYRVSVWRATSPDDAEFYPVGLRDALPAVGVPLRANDADVPLGLQPILDHVYAAGEYEDTDYARDPRPKLSPGDMAWATALLREKGSLRA